MSILNLVKNNLPLITVATGADDSLSVVHKFGFVDLNNNQTPSTLWSGTGLYTYLTSAQRLTVVSTDGDDTASVTIIGLDGNYEPLTEIVSINGATAVITTNSFLRVFRMQYTNGNEGDITASYNGDNIAKIDAGESQTLMALYTVPKGRTAYLMGYDLSVNKSKDAQVKMYIREHGGNFRVKGVAEVYENQYIYSPKIPMVINEKSDIEFRVTDVENNNTRVSCNFELLVDQCLNY